MSIEDRKNIGDIFKILMYVAFSIASFLMVSNYNTATEKLDKIDEKLDNLEKRLIRVEYEMKLR